MSPKDEHESVKRIICALHDSFGAIDEWFCVDEKVRSYVMKEKQYSINSILKNILLTNHALLINIREGVDQVLQGNHNMDDSNSDSSLDRVLLLESYQGLNLNCNGVSHRADDFTINALRKSFLLQKEECLSLLEVLEDGLGHKFGIELNGTGLGKFNLHQWIYFLALNMGKRKVSFDEVLISYVKNNIGL